MGGSGGFGDPSLVCGTPLPSTLALEVPSERSGGRPTLVEGFWSRPMVSVVLSLVLFPGSALARETGLDSAGFRWLARLGLYAACFRASPTRVAVGSVSLTPPPCVFLVVLISARFARGGGIGGLPARLCLDVSCMHECTAHGRASPFISITLLVQWSFVLLPPVRSTPEQNSGLKSSWFKRVGFLPARLASDFRIKSV